MLFDAQRRRFEIDLLDDARKRGIEPQRAAAVGTGIEFVGLKTRNLLGREGFACVLVVAGLAADGTCLAVGSLGGLWLDDVGGRRLGRGRGILSRCGKLHLETRNRGLKRLQPRLQTPTISAGLPCLGVHGWLCYVPDRTYATS